MVKFSESYHKFIATSLRMLDKSITYGLYQKSSKVLSFLVIIGGIFSYLPECGQNTCITKCIETIRVVTKYTRMYYREPHLLLRDILHGKLQPKIFINKMNVSTQREKATPEEKETIISLSFYRYIRENIKVVVNITCLKGR